MRHKIPEHIHYIISRLQNSGFETYLVGGAVRDLLFGLEPKDFDISTSATPEQIRRIFGGKHTRIIGRRFRLIHFYHGKDIVEISTFRKEPPQNREGGEDADKPFHDNEFGSAYEDAWRRDFTVNAIFYDPVKEKVIDHTGQGMEDLNSRTVRCIGVPSKRLQEDPVRILRALKLKAQYDFMLEEGTEKAVQENMHLIRNASISRLSLELQKILQKPFSDKMFKVFHHHGFLSYFLPFLHERWDTAECDYGMRLLAEKNRRVLEGRYRDSASLTLAATILPFVETKHGNLGTLWENFFGIDKEMRKMVNSLIFPCYFPRLINASAVKILLLQPYLFSMTREGKIRSNRKFDHARELLIIQNTIQWKNPEFDAYWN